MKTVDFNIVSFSSVRNYFDPDYYFAIRLLDSIKL